jgi:hypothetical protein
MVITKQFIGDSEELDLKKDLSSKASIACDYPCCPIHNK